MSCIYNEIYLTESEFTKQFDDIINNIEQTPETVWIIDHKVALIPCGLYESLKVACDSNEFQRKLQPTDH
jgi:hypothetical protein